MGFSVGMGAREGSVHLRQGRHGSPPSAGGWRTAQRMLFMLLGLAPLMLASCSFLTPASTGATLAANQTFTWPYSGTGKISYGEVLDPDEITDQKDLGTVSMIFTNLVTFNSSTLQVIPDAATSWDVGANGTSYTFHLRPNMRFSDGSPITARDFAYSIQRSLSPQLGCLYDANTYGAGPCSNPVNPTNGPGPTYLGHILGASSPNGGYIATGKGTLIGTTAAFGLQIIDEQTLRINLDAPIAYFLEALSYPTNDVLEQSLVENPKYAGGTWVDHLNLGGCSGPFKIVSYGAQDNLMTLVPNPYWEAAWGKKLTLTKVVRPIIESIDTEYASYRSGAAYDYTDVPASDYSFASGQSDFHQIPTLANEFFGMNFDMPPFDNEVIRRAFDLSLNKQLLVDRVENGGAIPSNHIVPEGMPGYNPNLTTPPPDSTLSLTGNQTVALNLLKTVQHTCATTGEAITPPDYCPYIVAKQGQAPQPIYIWVNTDNQTTLNLATAAAQAWSNALNLNVQIKKINSVGTTSAFSNLVADVILNGWQPPDHHANPAQMWILGWVADFPDPWDWLSNQFEITSIFDAGNVSIPQVTQLMQQADVEADPTKRMQEYNTIEQDLVNTVAWIPFQQDKLFWRLRPWVRGFALNELENMQDVDWPNVYIISH